MHARWPKHEKADEVLLISAAYVKQLVSNIRSVDDAANKKKLKKNKGKLLDPPSPGELVLYVADVFPKWQEDVIAILKNCFNGKAFAGEREALAADGLIKDKRVMPFVASIKVFRHFKYLDER
jgi:leucyl-tRNA synthetase